MKENEKEFYNIERELSIRKIITIIFVVILIIATIVIFSLYIAKEDFRKWVDVNILRKDISSQDIATIDLDTEKNNQIFCYDKNICVLNDKNLTIYDHSGQNISEISVNINTALFASNNKYLVIAEKNGQNFCVISNKTYLWEGQVDGEILQTCINKNGYVALVTTDTTYKSIITVYDALGKQVLKNYLSNTRVVDITLTNDNQYIAYAELDTSGALIQSRIKVIDIEKAKLNSEEAEEYVYEAEISKMIVNIEYQDKNNLVCGYDDSVEIINNANKSEILQIDSNTTFVSEKLKDSIAYVTEETTGIFNANSVLNIVNNINNQKYTYSFNEVVKEMYTYDDIIAINVGTEIYFVNSNGMLIKKFSSNQEITNVELSNNLAILIYKDSIEIIDL